MDLNMLKDLSKMELISLNHQIIDELKRRDEVANQTTISKFRVGDKVAFVANDEELFGIVIRVNRKSITIETHGFGQWRISPQLARNMSAEVNSKKKSTKNVHNLFKN